METQKQLNNVLMIIIETWAQKMQNTFYADTILIIILLSQPLSN